jgi:hypothetical protein
MSLLTLLRKKNSKFSSLKRIEPSTRLDFTFSSNKTYPQSEGQIVYDLIKGVRATLGADNSASTDDPSILYAGTPQGKAGYFAGDFFLTENEILSRLYDKSFWVNGEYPVLVTAIRLPDSFASQRWLFAGGDTGATDFWTLYYSIDPFLRFSHKGPGATLFDLTGYNGRYITIILQADFDNNKLYVSVNGGTISEVSYTFADYSQSAWKTWIGASINGANSALSGTEHNRIAVLTPQELLSQDRVEALHNQLALDHQKPYAFPTLDSLVNVDESCVLDVDARLVNSFVDLDSQYWIDTVSGNKFTLGSDATVSTDDPTFNGSIGSSEANFSFDGGDYFKADAGIMALDQVLKAHRTDASNPITYVLEFKTALFPKSMGLFSTVIYGGVSAGFEIRLSGSEVLQFIQYNGTDVETINTVTLEENTEYIVALRFDSGDDVFSYSINGGDFISASYSPETSTADTTGTLYIGARGNGSAPLTLGNEVKHVSIYDKLLSNTELKNIVRALQLRNGQSFEVTLPLEATLHQYDATIFESFAGSNFKDLGSGDIDLVPESGKEPIRTDLTGGSYFTLNGDVFESSEVPEDMNFHNGDKDFQISVLLQHGTITSTGCILDTRGATSTHPGFNIVIDDSYRVRMIHRSDDPLAWVTDTGTYHQIPVSDYKNSWYVLTVRYDSSENTARFYYNNELIGTQESYFDTITTPKDLTATSRLTIGRYGAGGGVLDAKIRSLLVFDNLNTSLEDVLTYLTRIHWETDVTGINDVEKPFYGSTAYPFPLLYTGQSLASQMLDNLGDAGGVISFNEDIENYAEKATIHILAVGGTPFLKSTGGSDYFVNDDNAPTYSAGTMTDMFDLYPDNGNPMAVMTKHQSSDTGAGATTSNIEGAYRWFGDTYLPSLYENYQGLIVNLWHGHKDTDWTINEQKAMTKGLQNAITNGTNLFFGFDLYDRPKRDNVHLVSYDVAGVRASAYYAGLMGWREIPQPVTMASAVIDGTTLTLTLNLNDATDITVATDAYKSFLFVDDTDGNISFTGESKINNSTIELTLASTPTAGTGELYCMDNGLTASAPEVVKGNDELELPLRSGYIAV